MPKAKQVEMFDQKRIASIETQADKFDNAREMRAGLKDDMANAEFKLAELLHENADKVDKQEDRKGRKLLVYERGNYRVIVRQGKESVGVKVAKEEKGERPSGEPGGES